MTKYNRKSELCLIPDCGRKYGSSGVCTTHYNMARYEKHSWIRSYMTTKGFRYTPSYASYMNMLQRCYNKNNYLYCYYGGRGIKICERWLQSYDNFLQDMGERTVGYGIERIDNDGDYTPENCKWATQAEQNRNKRHKR